MKILMKNLGVIEWIIIIPVGLFLIFLLFIFVDDAIIATMHANVGKVIIKTVNGRKFSLKVPVRPTARQLKTKGEQLYYYDISVENLWGSSWFLSYIPEKKSSFLQLPTWDYPYSYLITP
ncbi:MAG: hypothetical protein IKC08_04045 [Lentisphaeria bacterium]|nr:hypothetical protein [Lentisphaeria bacterium]